MFARFLVIVLLPGMGLPGPLYSQWSKTLHQVVDLPDTLSAFSISKDIPFDTIFWIGSDILVETRVVMTGIRESGFGYWLASDRYRWTLDLEEDRKFRPLTARRLLGGGVEEMVALRIHVPEYFLPSPDGYFRLHE